MTKLATQPSWVDFAPVSGSQPRKISLSHERKLSIKTQPSLFLGETPHIVFAYANIMQRETKNGTVMLPANKMLQCDSMYD